MAEHVLVYSPGERLVTMTAAGHAVLYEVADDGTIAPVRDVSRTEPERFQVGLIDGLMHLTNGEAEALCDPTLECDLTTEHGKVTCEPCRQRAAHIYSTEQAP